MTASDYAIDTSDRELITAFRHAERATVTDVARATGMARGTVQARLDRLVRSGVIAGWGPELDPTRAGYPVTSFTTLQITQGGLQSVVDGLRSLPEVLDVHVTTGGGDLLCRIVATSNDHLHDLIQQIVSIEGVSRTDSQLILAAPVQRTVADLIAEEAS